MCFECVHQSLSYLFLHVCPFLLKGRQRKPIAVATELLQTTSTRILWLKLRCQDGSQSSTPNIALNHSSRVTNIRGKHTHTHTKHQLTKRAVTTGPSGQGPRSTSASRSAGPFFISFCQGGDGVHLPLRYTPTSEHSTLDKISFRNSFAVCLPAVANLEPDLHHPFGETTRLLGVAEKTLPAMFEGYIHFRAMENHPPVVSFQ